MVRDGVDVDFEGLECPQNHVGRAIVLRGSGTPWMRYPFTGASEAVIAVPGMDSASM